MNILTWSTASMLEDSERVIIDVDFRSHFEIARAVDSYDRILKSLPVIYVGSLTRLKPIFKSWPMQLDLLSSKIRCLFHLGGLLAYLLAKWHSPYQRQFDPGEQNFSSIDSSDHNQCSGHLKSLPSSLQFEMEGERIREAY
ncbi:hypothetical protein NC651_025931 [Populus alba x Populus x berolinensis]|nr:hypothetical protein NC651_025931 [Populus alba x Populus x berolinensis]